ncbi:MAG: tRNA uridine-5-carboxymethylaminomethyl(34) synthesis GTPase MnmE [Proteobacteria bacterium]|nr:tRNA uridine-5-carboxymethylaminomethyl(34) synthesis GTPase MnmE [Pseudomonadota bacterium]
MFTNKDTIAAIATAAGRSGIGIIRISGDNSKEIAEKLTGINPTPRFAHYAEFKAANNDLIDKGIIIYFKAPASYTGEDVIECHLHGSRILLDVLLDEIYSLGARAARPGEFTERAFLNNKMDLVQAEAVADLIDSSSKKAARSAMQSLSGMFSRQVLDLREQIFKASSLIEASLDFTEEEDVGIKLEPVLSTINESINYLSELLKKAEAGSILSKSPSIVIIGPPNVGKSSIINYLSRNDSAIVSARPGTTRDIIKETVLLEGNLFTLIDTAGIHATEDEIELEGINRTNKATNMADLVLYVIDASKDDKQQLTEASKSIPDFVKTTVVRNKIDLCNKEDLIRNEKDIFVSAKTGEGMEILIQQICKSLEYTSAENDIIFARKRHIDAIKRISESLNRTLEAIEKNSGLEIIAEELRQSLNGFDEITGKTTTDDILGEIFSRFCIGK